MSSFHVLAQQLDELDVLHTEAKARRARLTCDAIERVQRALEAGIRPLADDVRLVQEFMGSRTAQDRFGK